MTPSATEPPVSETATSRVSSAWVGLVLAALLALGAALASGWDVARDPRQTFLCSQGHPDCLGNHWLLGWVSDQIRTGGSLLHNDRYYWPVGDAPWLAGNGNEAFLYAPLDWALGWPLSANVYLLGMLAFNGVAAYVLARSVGARPAAALPAATTGAVLVYATWEMRAGRFSQASVGWLALFLGAWLRQLTAPSWQRGALAGGLLAATSFFYWYHGFFGVVAGALLVAARVGTREGRDTLRANIVSYILFAGVYLLVIAWPLHVFLDGWRSIPGTSESVFPHPEAAGDGLWPSVPFLEQPGRGAGRALPFTTCLLAAVGALSFSQQKRVGPLPSYDLRSGAPWRVAGLVAVVVLFLGLMAGTKIEHGPYEAVYGLAEPLRRFWWPSRHVVVVNLALVALAGIGLERLLAGWEARRGTGRASTFGITTAGFVLAVSVPMQLELQGAPWRVRYGVVEWPATFYVGLAELPGTVLAEPPLSPQVAGSQVPLMYQRLHGKQLLSGHAPWVARVRPRAWDDFMVDNTFTRALMDLERGRLRDGLVRFDAADLQRLLDAGVRTWVVNREHFPLAMKGLTEAYAQAFNALFGPAVRSGPRVQAWDAGRWDGLTHEVRVPPFLWPDDLPRAQPGLPLQGMRPMGLAFKPPPDPGR